MPKKPKVDKWQNVTIQAGSSASAEIPFDPLTHDLAVKGSVYGADGEKVKGSDKPKVTVQETGTGAVVMLDPVQSQDVFVKTRVVEQEEEEEEEAPEV